MQQPTRAYGQQYRSRRQDRRRLSAPPTAHTPTLPVLLSASRLELRPSASFSSRRSDNSSKMDLMMEPFRPPVSPGLDAGPTEGKPHGGKWYRKAAHSKGLTKQSMAGHAGLKSDSTISTRTKRALLAMHTVHERETSSPSGKPLAFAGAPN
ncbi:hypothetical protein ONE63_003078 [Megalurothrips usitatus]|uniref:Uncharacterized protein n=1 Tax=Megalurothrips usitatus TaxID=439358 RepID=A0AAV7X9V8_9NEOP|nr:hypothetical protein ONE63_003078 [Megalurothrips usitatus]